MRTVQTVVFLGLLVGSFLLPAHGAENVAGQDPATGQPPPPGKIQVRDTTPRFSLRGRSSSSPISARRRRSGFSPCRPNTALNSPTSLSRRLKSRRETLNVDNQFYLSGGVKKFHELSPADKAIVWDRERKRLARRMETNLPPRSGRY